MPRLQRRPRGHRGELDPDLSGGLSIGPSPRARHQDPDIIDELQAAYAEHSEQVAELDSAAGVPCLRSWGYWAFEPGIPDELRDVSTLGYHECQLGRGRWLADAGQLARWEIHKLRRLAADDVAADWHPWKDMLAAVLAATPTEGVIDPTTGPQKLPVIDQQRPPGHPKE